MNIAIGVERRTLRRTEILEAIERHETFLAKAKYAIDRGWPCPRCHKPVSRANWEEGDHPCIGLTRMDLGGLSDELATMDEEAARAAEIAADPEGTEYVAVDMSALVQLPTLRLTREEEFAAEMRAAERGMG